MARILVTGSRHLKDSQILSETLDGVLESLKRFRPSDEVTLVHGGAQGADALAAMWASERMLDIERHEADWHKHKRAAGPIRNQKMVDSGADICVAFLADDSVGTADCIKRAIKAGIPVVEVRV